MIMLDVDRFKLSNDTYGHQSGDRVLVIVASLLGGRTGRQGATIRLGLVSGRRDRPALQKACIEEEFLEGAGSHWDPEILRHFLACCEELYAISDRGLGQSLSMAVDRATGRDGLLSY